MASNHCCHPVLWFENTSSLAFKDRALHVGGLSNRLCVEMCTVCVSPLQVISPKNHSQWGGGGRQREKQKGKKEREEEKQKQEKKSKKKKKTHNTQTPRFCLLKAKVVCVLPSNKIITPFLPTPFCRQTDRCLLYKILPSPSDNTAHILHFKPTLISLGCRLCGLKKKKKKKDHQCSICSIIDSLCPMKMMMNPLKLGFASNNNKKKGFHAERLASTCSASGPLTSIM